MFECQICGVLSLGGSACPACGSQLRKDLSLEQDGTEALPSEVPGLDDAAAAWYDLEGIDPPTEKSPTSPQKPVPNNKATFPLVFRGHQTSTILDFRSALEVLPRGFHLRAVAEASGGSLATCRPTHRVPSECADGGSR